MLPNISVVCDGRPGPGRECMVWPPATMAATPVGAVTRMFPRSRSPCTILCSVNVFPVPGPPVKKIFCPRIASSTACSCNESSGGGIDGCSAPWEYPAGMSTGIAGTIGIASSAAAAATTAASTA
eukprot:3430596-Pleurochrysis_carterae.AAC.1